MTELNAISKSVIHAFLARLPDATTSLAGFNVAFTAYYACGSATEVSYLVTISWLRDRRSILPLLRFFCLITAGPVALALVVAFTAAGDWLYGGLFGASPAAVREAKLATFVFCLSAPILIARAFTFGVLMINRRTMLISWSTLAPARPPLGGSLVLLPRFVSGAAAGAAALVTCMAVEAIVSGFFAARYFRALPAAAGPVPPRPRAVAIRLAPHAQLVGGDGHGVRHQHLPRAPPRSRPRPRRLRGRAWPHRPDDEPDAQSPPHRPDARPHGRRPGGPPALFGAGGRGVRPHRDRALRHPR